MSTGAMERSDRVNLDPVSAGEALSFAGLSYRWRTLVLSGEVQKGDTTSYAFCVGTRF